MHNLTLICLLALNHHPKRDEKHLITTYIFTSLSWRTRGTTRTLGTLSKIENYLKHQSLYSSSHCFLSLIDFALYDSKWREPESELSSVSVTGSCRSIQTFREVHMDRRNAPKHYKPTLVCYS